MIKYAQKKNKMLEKEITIRNVERATAKVGQLGF